MPKQPIKYNSYYIIILSTILLSLEFFAYIDETLCKKWSPISRLEDLANFSSSDMKGPSNVSIRLDLFPEHNSSSSKMEFPPDEKIHDSEISKWSETEQLNSQVVFINPEWDEIEEEKAGIPSFLNSISPNVSSDKIVPSQVTEFVVTDTESVSSVTVNLDELTEESEEIVAVISDSEPDVIHAEFLAQVDEQGDKSLKKLLHPFPAEEIHIESWKNPENYKPQMESKSHIEISQNEKGKSLSSENFRKDGVEITETSKLMKASCYVVQNGKITKPFYIVKNPMLKENALYKNINKNDDVLAKKGLKNFTISSNTAVMPTEEQNLLPLGRSSMRKKENFRKPQLSKLGKNQDFIKIIEQPGKAKKIIVNKLNDNKNYRDSNLRKGFLENHGGCGKNLSTDPIVNSCEGEDLMWLLDFKLDNLFNESSLPALSQLDDSLEQYTEFPGKFVDVDGSISNFSESDADDKIKVEIGCQTETMTSRPIKNFNNKVGPGKQQHKLEARSESALPNRTFSDLKCSENRKPPFTYTELIECALQEKGPLTVSEIYNWISETFPYYKSWDDRWKNSVRHNLSINPYFRKGTKARQGSGHLWTVNKSEDNSKINSWKRHRFHEFEEFSKRLRYTGGTEKQEESPENISPKRIVDETELATASIEDKENRRLHRDVLMAACVDSNFISTTNVSLEQSAEEILSGVKKNVEVQYLEPVKSPCENDFLNPISKEILMGECGLLNQIELNLTAETGEHLGIVDSMTDSEHIFGIPDELNFHYDMPSHAPQLLPLAK